MRTSRRHRSSSRTCGSWRERRPWVSRSGPRSVSGIAARSSPRRSIPNLAPVPARGSSRRTRRCGPRRPARPPSSTTASGASAADASRSLRPPELAGAATVAIGPALVLSVILGLFHVSAYVFIRGHAGARVPLLVIAAIAGAWAGDTVAARMAIDPLRIGEYPPPHGVGLRLVRHRARGRARGARPGAPTGGSSTDGRDGRHPLWRRTDDGEGSGPGDATPQAGAPGLDPQAPR